MFRVISEMWGSIHWKIPLLKDTSLFHHRQWPHSSLNLIILLVLSHQMKMTALKETIQFNKINSRLVLFKLNFYGKGNQMWVLYKIQLLWILALPWNWEHYFTKSEEMEARGWFLLLKWFSELRSSGFATLILHCAKWNLTDRSSAMNFRTEMKRWRRW